MEIYDSYQNVSSIYQQLALKKSELSNLDKKELEKIPTIKALEEKIKALEEKIK